MPKYRNNTKDVLRFRTHELNGVKTNFVLKPKEEVDLYRDNLQIEGLEKVEKKIKIKKTKKGEQ